MRRTTDGRIADRQVNLGVNGGAAGNSGSGGTQNVVKTNDIIDSLTTDVNFCFEQSAITSQMMLNEVSKVNFDKYFEELLFNYINNDVKMIIDVNT